MSYLKPGAYVLVSSSYGPPRIGVVEKFTEKTVAIARLSDEQQGWHAAHSGRYQRDKVVAVFDDYGTAKGTWDAISGAYVAKKEAVRAEDARYWAFLDEVLEPHRETRK